MDSLVWVTHTGKRLSSTMFGSSMSLKDLRCRQKENQGSCLPTG